MSATDGLTRGMEVIDTGAPLSVPVGGATLGRIFNCVENLGPVDTRTTSPIHRSAPAFIQLDTKLSIFETGIKVVDLLAPYRRGGKIGLFGGAGVIMEFFLYYKNIYRDRILVTIHELMESLIIFLDIVEAQSKYGFWGWNLWRQPIGFIVFLISSLAECERLPFDLPEAEEELVA
ncbi:hypothetical protein RJ640_015169, partial [Escallonia rubra]